MVSSSSLILRPEKGVHSIPPCNASSTIYTTRPGTAGTLGRRPKRDYSESCQRMGTEHFKSISRQLFLLGIEDCGYTEAHPRSKKEMERLRPPRSLISQAEQIPFRSKATDKEDVIKTIASTLETSKYLINCSPCFLEL